MSFWQRLRRWFLHGGGRHEPAWDGDTSAAWENGVYDDDVRLPPEHRNDEEGTT